MHQPFLNKSHLRLWHLINNGKYKFLFFSKIPREISNFLKYLDCSHYVWLWRSEISPYYYFWTLWKENAKKDILHFWWQGKGFYVIDSFALNLDLCPMQVFAVSCRLSLLLYEVEFGEDFAQYNEQFSILLFCQTQFNDKSCVLNHFHTDTHFNID